MSISDGSTSHLSFFFPIDNEDGVYTGYFIRATHLREIVQQCFVSGKAQLLGGNLQSLGHEMAVVPGALGDILN